jgi:acyl-CoA thioesterase
MAVDPLKALKARSQQEPFRQLLGMEVLDIAPGYAKTAMQVKSELTNVFGMLHGGAVFSLLDEAFQLACNARGRLAVALELKIYYLAPAAMGSKLIAEVKEVNRTKRSSLHEAVVYEQEGKVVARASAMAYRKDKKLPLDEAGNLLLA